MNNSALFEVSIGKRVVAEQLKEGGKYPVFSANVFEPFGYIDELLIRDFGKQTVIWGIDGDWMVNVLPVGYEFYPTDHCGMVRVKSDEVLPRILAHSLEQAGREVGFSRNYRASIDRIKTLSVKMPPISEQQKAVAEIEKYEAEIVKAAARLPQFEHAKRNVLEKYLR